MNLRVLLLSFEINEKEVAKRKTRLALIDTTMKQNKKAKLNFLTTNFVIIITLKLITNFNSRKLVFSV